MTFVVKHSAGYKRWSGRPKVRSASLLKGTLAQKRSKPFRYDLERCNARSFDRILSRHFSHYRRTYA